ncbi:TraB/GumN family protein [Alkalihalobacillus hemicellulosilyticus]|uniref:GumN protein n=1 Tax=Halalkalibacter hemicellulosilyticusJCM 9152 TaxID=1236971 RepID=W4QAE3_9BACI|nr:TraB/GumN family protein [Halalkalibacter hemicellulosilyticus]GAE28922.1 hypothetical protein JCM9152_260 [Halalkalibacter hemicellulosilyticusJCM 9152]
MRNLIVSMVILFVLSGLVACQSINTIQPNLSFQDERLENLINKMISEEANTDSSIKNELHAIKKLDLSDYGITNLEGIDILEGLEEIILTGNELESLEPLLTLPNLLVVNLEGVSIDTSEGSDDLGVIQALLENDVEVIYDDEDEQIFSKGLLFEVENNHSKIYLFGSIHINSEELFPLHPEIEEAFDQSDQVAFVVNVNEKDEVAIMQAMVELGVYNDGTSLENHISKELYEELISFISNYELEEEAITRFKPWAVADMLQSLLIENYGYSNKKNIDQYFLMKAEEAQKPVMSLEHFKDQMILSNEIELEQQELLLEKTLNSIQNSGKVRSNLETMWVTSQAEKLAELRDSQKYRDLDTSPFSLALVEERDQQMAEKLEEILKEEQEMTTFVVVNTLHLIGNGNITELLEDQGYRVNRLLVD